MHSLKNLSKTQIKQVVKHYNLKHHIPFSRVVDGKRHTLSKKELIVELEKHLYIDEESKMIKRKNENLYQMPIEDAKKEHKKLVKVLEKAEKKVSDKAVKKEIKKEVKEQKTEMKAIEAPKKEYTNMEIMEEVSKQLDMLPVLTDEQINKLANKKNISIENKTRAKIQENIRGQIMNNSDELDQLKDDWKVTEEKAKPKQMSKNVAKYEEKRKDKIKELFKMSLVDLQKLATEKGVPLEITVNKKKQILKRSQLISYLSEKI